MSNGHAPPFRVSALFSFTDAAAVSMVAAPVFRLAGLLSLFIQRWSALRFLAAGFTAALPLAILSWLGP